MDGSRVVIPYRPRKAFLPFHNRTQRWACLVAHRRAGKTVAAVNDIIRAAITYQGDRGLFAYIAPYRSQAKAVAWQYFQEFAAPITQAKNEQELTITLMNGSQVRLYGADNADAMRGLGFSGVYMDEYGDFKPSVFGNVIRPALSDKQGWAVFGGTPKGKNQFWEIYETAQRLPQEWFLLRLPSSTSGLLPVGELAAARAQLAEDQYLQEYETSFEAAILGAFYGKEMREDLVLQGDDGVAFGHFFQDVFRFAFGNTRSPGSGRFSHHFTNVSGIFAVFFRSYLDDDIGDVVIFRVLLLVIGHFVTD